MTMLFVYAGISLGVSFVCSLLESALLTVSVGHLAAKETEGNRMAARLRAYRANLDVPLASILSANTVAHTVGAAGVGAEAARLWQDFGIAAASSVMTILILLATEILPKTLGAQNANRLIGFTAVGIATLTVLMYPLVILATRVNRLVSRRGGGPLVSREEVAAYADLGLAAGTLSEDEAAVIRNVIAMRTVCVSDVMTPRTVVESIDATMSIGEFARSPRPSHFARLIVVEEGNLDRAIGMVHRSAILASIRRGELSPTFSSLARPLGAIPDTATCAGALTEFLRRGDHLMLAVDEYGGTSGVVSLEDVIETMLGVEIVGETDVAADMREIARRRSRERLERRLAAGETFDAERPPSAPIA